jgi:hypothetical protein
MQDDDQDEEDRRAERHIEQVRRAAGEGAHVEGVDYEGDTVEGAPPESNLEPQDRELNDEGAPLEDPDTRTPRDEGDEAG